MNKFSMLSMALFLFSIGSATAVTSKSDKLIEASAGILLGASASKIVSKFGMNDCFNNFCSTRKSVTTWAGTTSEIAIDSNTDKVIVVMTSYRNGKYQLLLDLMISMFGEPTIKTSKIMTMTIKQHIWHSDTKKYDLTKRFGTALNGEPLQNSYTLFVKYAR